MILLLFDINIIIIIDSAVLVPLLFPICSAVGSLYKSCVFQFFENQLK